MKNKVVIYMARDEGVMEEDVRTPQQGKIHLFYDTPLLEYDNKERILKWGCARKIGEIPSYMYPSLKEKEYIMLVEDNLV